MTTSYIKVLIVSLLYYIESTIETRSHSDYSTSLTKAMTVGVTI